MKRKKETPEERARIDRMLEEGRVAREEVKESLDRIKVRIDERRKRYS